MSAGLKQAFSRELVFALDLCESAGRIAMNYFVQGVEVIEKSDGSPVTKADKECERMIREAIAAKFPGDAILGEEEGESPGADDTTSGGTPKQKRKWIIDPIDGTYGFARGVPSWSLLVALEIDGEISLGVVHAPASDEMFWAERGRGAFKNGRRLEVSDIDNVAKSQFEFGGLNRILKLGHWDGFTRIVQATERQRGFGDYLSFVHVFEGKAEAMLEVGLKPWDLAPMKILAQEAGGRFSALDGTESIYHGSCLISNGLVHEDMLALLKGS